MARPRPVLPGKIYFVTRTCAARQFLLRPSAAVNRAILYCLGLALEKPGVNVQILWIMAMSNHLHYGIYDPDGTYPLFLEHFHKMLAKVLNCHWGRWGNLFAYEQTAVVELVDADAVFDKMIYSIANAVKDHLVKKAADWPGVCSLEAQLGNEEVVVRRPDWFFQDDSLAPKVVRFRFQRPPPFRHLSQKQWKDKIMRAVATYERTALEQRRASGKLSVLGPGGVRAQSAFDYPKTHRPQREIKPRVATVNKWRRIETLQRNKAWLDDYATALAAYRAGNRDAVFPPGTWKLHRERHVQRRAA